MKQFMTAQALNVNTDTLKFSIQNVQTGRITFFVWGTFGPATAQVTTFVELVPVITTIYRITVDGVNYEFTTTDVLPATLVNGLLAVVNADPNRVVDATNVANELVLTARVAGIANIAIEATDSPGSFDSVTETVTASVGTVVIEISPDDGATWFPTSISLVAIGFGTIELGPGNYIARSNVTGGTAASLNAGAVGTYLAL